MLVLTYEGGPLDGAESRVSDFIHPAGGFVDVLRKVHQESPVSHRYISHSKVPKSSNGERRVRMIHCGIVPTDSIR